RSTARSSPASGAGAASAAAGAGRADLRGADLVAGGAVLAAGAALAAGQVGGAGHAVARAVTAAGLTRGRVALLRSAARKRKRAGVNESLYTHSCGWPSASSPST